MKCFVKIMFAAFITITAFETGAAQQPVVYSDISISAITLNAAGAAKKVPAVSKSITPADHPVTTVIPDDVLKCRITVSNSSASNAFAAKLIIVLPAGAWITAGTLPSNATLVSERVAIGGGPGYIQFDLQAVFSNQLTTVEFTFNKSPNINKLSAFVVCGVPDANTTNNYKEITY
jgi:hypothetical protein